MIKLRDLKWALEFALNQGAGYPDKGIKYYYEVIMSVLLVNVPSTSWSEDIELIKREIDAREKKLKKIEQILK